MPRLETLLCQWQGEHDDPLLQRRAEDLRDLLAVLRFCLDKNVSLVFA